MTRSRRPALVQDGRRIIQPGARAWFSAQRLTAVALHRSRGDYIVDLGRKDASSLCEAGEGGSCDLRIEPTLDGAEAGVTSQPVRQGLKVAGVLSEEGIRLKRRLDVARRLQSDSDANGLSETAVPHLKLLVNEERNGLQTRDTAKSSRSWMVPV